jgi:hypothetical protein
MKWSKYDLSIYDHPQEHIAEVSTCASLVRL